MLETNRAQIIQSIRGINEQLALTDPENVALVKGTYPALIGLQERVPGKVKTGEYAYPINGIAVFYNVYGRRYMLWEGLNLTIDEVTWDFSYDWREPWVADYADDFESYLAGEITILYQGDPWSYKRPGHTQKFATGVWDDFEYYSAGYILSGEITGGDSDFPGIADPGYYVQTPLVVDNFESYSTGVISSLTATTEARNGASFSNGFFF